MSVYSPLRTSQSDADDELRRFLEEAAARHLLGRRSQVTAVERSPSRASTSYDCEIVAGRLAGGGTVRAFLKDFGRSRLPKDAQRERRERELGVYRALIGDAGIGTARYYGSVWDDARGRHWLLLEHVDGTVLASLDVEQWIAPMAWLARMQARFAGAAFLSAPPAFLQRHDAAFFEARADRALRSVARIAPALTGRITAVLRGYEQIVAPMANQPPTLVHGAFRPANMLVDNSRRPARICPVDWELAAVGSPLYDLAFFCDGFEPPILDRMWDAYLEEAAAGGLSVPPREEFRWLIDCFRLYRVIAWLAPAVAKRYAPADIEKLVARGELLLPLVAS
jgi:aminoglycoside phosphotransferase (APT) family kinase protein